MFRLSFIVPNNHNLVINYIDVVVLYLSRCRGIKYSIRIKKSLQIGKQTIIVNKRKTRKMNLIQKFYCFLLLFLFCLCAATLLLLLAHIWTINHLILFPLLLFIYNTLHLLKDAIPSYLYDEKNKMNYWSTNISYSVYHMKTTTRHDIRYTNGIKWHI